MSKLKVEQIESSIKELQLKLSNLTNQVNTSNKEKNILNEELKMLQISFSNKTTKLELVSKILSAKTVDNVPFNRFKQLLHTDFSNFANSESSLAEEEQATIRLQLVEERIKMVLSFPEIYDKNVVAIGGGFSAGKSEFVSSFFKDNKIKLPIGIKPVTAIPTYIVPGNENKIKGYTERGGTIDIAPDFYEKLSHDFVKSFSFNLKDIMPAMVISTPFIISFEHICFIDTPGYDPASTIDGSMKKDSDTAEEYLEKANVLLWLVGLDSNGTIPNSDLEFLNNLALKNKKLYIVANKADLKSKEDIKIILDNFKETLDSEDLEYEGISAYNSIGKKEVTFRKMSVSVFLKQQDQLVNIQAQVQKELSDIFKLYDRAINNDIKFIKMITNVFKSLKIDILNTNFDKYGEKVSNQQIAKMKKKLDIKPLEKQLNDLKKIRKEIVGVVKEIFGVLK